jgi:triphosphoribosyl-dephospho-CoA synthase
LATEPRIEAAFQAACEAELAALKPGNVHRFAPGHGMTMADFQRSAAAAAPCIARRGCSAGERILSATEASWKAVGCNTNLGIVLLCAPLAMAR